MALNDSIVDPIVKLDAQALAAPGWGEGADEEAIPVGTEHQLFADDHLIARRVALHRRLNPPRKEGEILAPVHPWEGSSLVYGSVVEEESELRMYYKATNWDPMTNANFRQARGYGKYPICLATSDDGRSFSRPALEQAVIPETNIVIDDQIDDFTVLKDHSDSDPSRRYKLLASKGNWWAGLTPATSPDGLRWTWGQENAVAYFGDRCSYWFDPQQKKHVAWSRNYQVLGGRHIFHKETPDFDEWEDLRADHPKLVITMDRYDHEQTQFYGGYAFFYQSLYFAYLEVYYLHHQRIDTQLCCSRDGRNWTRLCDREIFLANGAHGEFDAYWVVPTFNPPVLRDGQLLIHYGGRCDPHTQPGFSHIPPGMHGAFGLATLREDGFVSLDATGEEGVLETKPLELDAPRNVLEVNACPFLSPSPAAPMELQVEVLGEDGRPVVAYAIAPTDRDDTLWHRFSLEQPLSGKIRLRFRMRNARLYSFRLT